MLSAGSKMNGEYLMGKEKVRACYVFAPVAAIAFLFIGTPNCFKLLPRLDLKGSYSNYLTKINSVRVRIATARNCRWELQFHSWSCQMFCSSGSARLPWTPCELSSLKIKS
ncbi:hypothetical protein HNY73_013229 [Argiope bruennichi]|uniref:Uncharacterized protein n=1 Tax=Argiope bruennichi TaxID=94029 RepID=A0A8T0F265_ARGBR|nr:hypothetical protein HNY73_013229 [Argiope bruennichi]